MSDFRGENIPVNWYKGVSRLLEKLSNGLTENPDVAKHVRYENLFVGFVCSKPSLRVG